MLVFYFSYLQKHMKIITCNTSSLVNFSPFESTASYSHDQTVNCGKETSRVIILSPAANFATPDRAHGLQPAEGAREDPVWSEMWISLNLPKKMEKNQNA